MEDMCLQGARLRSEENRINENVSFTAAHSTSFIHRNVFLRRRSC